MFYEKVWIVESNRTFSSFLLPGFLQLLQYYQGQVPPQYLDDSNNVALATFALVFFLSLLLISLMVLWRVSIQDLVILTLKPQGILENSTIKERL